MTDVMSCFSPEVNKSHSSLHWDCIPLFVECNQSENQFKENLYQNVEQNERSQEREQKWPSLVIFSYMCYFLLHVYL